MKYIDKEELSRLYHIEKTSVNKIAKIFNCTPTTIYSKMRKYGLKLRSKKEAQILRRIDKSTLDINKILNLYYDKNQTLEQVGKHFGVSATTIRKRLISKGYKPKNISDYSESGRRSDFSHEEISEMIRLYCNENLSFAKIGRKFETGTQKVKTLLQKNDVQLRTLNEVRQLHKKRTTTAGGSLRKRLEIYQKPSIVPEEKIPLEQVTPEMIWRMRQEENLTIDKIAVRCSLTNLEVYEILKKFEKVGNNKS